MELDLPELEQEFRHQWREYDPSQYDAFLARISETQRPELLARLLSAELEFAYQPPTVVAHCATALAGAPEDEDERVRPCVALFMLRFPELRKHPEAIIRLIVLEYALRLRHDRVPPNIDSYFDLCPQAQTQDRLIKLLELTESKLHGVRHEPTTDAEVSHADSTVKEMQAAVSITLDPLPYNLGCFLLIRLIGRGGMGYVHAAIDLRSTAQVAVKVMRRIDAWSVYRFVEEFSWLSQLNHPNLVRLYDAFSEGDVRYFSMELVEGKTIRDWFLKLSCERTAQWDALRKVLAQLASAIHFLHARGVLHRDIKCSNVMITPRRRAVLLDLGLAVRAGESVPSAYALDGDRLIGTLQYIAPEGLSGRSLTYASDWYSFGVMLVEVLTDAYPPIHVDLGAERESQRYIVDDDRLRSSLAECPADLRELCLDLLSIDPQRRPTGVDTLRRLGGDPASGIDLGSVQPLCGRDDCLTRMETALAEMQRGEASLVVIRGDSGMGKTALLQHWLGQPREQDALVLSLRCYRQDHTPLRLLNLLIQALVRVLSEMTDVDWRGAIKPHGKLMARTFPQIQQLLTSDATVQQQELDTSNASMRRNASQVALSQFLTSLSHLRPIIIAVDDVQWSDRESIAALIDLIATQAFRGLVVLAESTDQDSLLEQVLETAVEAPRSDQRQPKQVAIELTPLSADDGARLIRGWSRLVGRKLSPAIQQDLINRSAGSPFLLLELYRTYLHLTRDEAFSDADWLSSTARDAAQRRVSMLPIQAENVLQYLAVADQPIGFHQLQMVTRIAPHELQRTLSYLGSQGWIRSRGLNLDSEVEIAHESFRQLFIESLPSERRHRRHFRMARILSGETPPPWPRIAHHYWAAERFREATACYMEAALVAAKTSAYQEALFFLDRAMHAEADRTPREQARAWKLKADCLAGLGSSLAAAKLYEQLSQEADDPAQAVIIQCLAGEQWIRAGQLEKGLRLLRQVLSEFGVTCSKRTALSQLCLRIHALRVALRKPQVVPELETREIKPFTTLEQSLTRLSAPLTFLDNQLGPDLILRLNDLSMRRGSAFDHAQVMVRTAILLSFGGARWRPVALRRLRLGRALARQTRVASARASGYFCMFIWSVQRGDHLRALRHGKRALELFQQGQQNAQWEIQFLNWIMLDCYWYANRHRELREQLALLRESARRRADPMSSYWMNVNAAIWSSLALDEAAQARQALEISAAAIANQSFQSPRFFLWLSRVQLANYEGDWQAAQDLLQADWQKLKSSFVLGTNHYLWMALSVRLCTDLVSHRNDPGNPRWLQDARHTAKRMEGLADRVFAAYGRAFSLVVQAAGGRVADQETWRASTQQLHAYGHPLMAVAVQWHQSLYAPADSSRRLQAEAEAALRGEGCRAPRHLLDIVLPLPR